MRRSRWLQGPHSQPDSPARQMGGAANGPYGTPPHGANAFGTPASGASQHSFEDEETLLLDPQVITLLTQLIPPLTLAAASPWGAHFTSVHLG